MKEQSGAKVYLVVVKNGTTPASFSFISSFQTHITDFSTKIAM